MAANRWVKFVHTIEIEGFDFTDADFACQVRDQRDTTTTPRADLATTTTPGAEGVRFVSYAADITTLELVISAATMQAIDTANDGGKPGEDGEAWWDIIITPDGGDAFVALSGQFIIKAGATTT